MATFYHFDDDYMCRLQESLEAQVKAKTLTQVDANKMLAEKRKMRESWKRDSWVGRRVEFTTRPSSGVHRSMGVVIADEDFRHLRIEEEGSDRTIWVAPLEDCKEAK